MIASNQLSRKAPMATRQFRSISFSVSYAHRASEETAIVSIVGLAENPQGS
jgi:hypothetical protein